MQLLTPRATDAPPSSRPASVAQKLIAFYPPRWVAVLTALALAALAACGDAMTAAAAPFTLFYVVALAFGTWFAGARAGYGLAVFAVASGAAANYFGVPHVTSLRFIAWNTAVDGALYVGSVRVLSALRRRLDREVTARLDALGQLRHAERLTTIGRLASGIAHEIGTPLNVISGRAELIIEGNLEPEAVQSSARVILAQTERVATTMRQLLDFSRRGGAQVTRTELGDLVETTAKLLAPLAARRGVTIAYRGEPVEASVNGGELEQVITNLVTNAIHAMPRGGTVELTTYAERCHPPGHRRGEQRDYAVIRVRDHGTGIAPEVLPRIFDPFFTTKSIGEGTGLGLSVAYGIVHDHHGFIRVDTRFGEGTTFDVYLPRRTAG